jgi:uncharacterized membrane protein YGL010W
MVTELDIKYAVYWYFKYLGHCLIAKRIQAIFDKLLKELA